MHITSKQIQYEYGIYSASKCTRLIHHHGGDQKFEIKSLRKASSFSTEVVLI